VTSAVLGGQVDFGIQPLSSALRAAADGQVKILGIHAEERSDRCPDIPTMKELGFEGVVLENTSAAYAPPGTPQHIVDAYAEALRLTCEDPQFIADCEQREIFRAYLPPDELMTATLQSYEDIQPVLARLMEDVEE
jgi:tripartite-type tricarboxylate transporter receptor subunit TctC